MKKFFNYLFILCSVSSFVITDMRGMEEPDSLTVKSDGVGSHFFYDKTPKFNAVNRAYNAKKPWHVSYWTEYLGGLAGAGFAIGFKTAHFALAADKWFKDQEDVNPTLHGLLRAAMLMAGKELAEENAQKIVLHSINLGGQGCKAILNMDTTSKVKTGLFSLGAITTLAPYVYQRYEFLKTRQEVRQEHKETRKEVITNRREVMTNRKETKKVGKKVDQAHVKIDRNNRQNIELHQKATADRQAKYEVTLEKFAELGRDITTAKTLLETLNALTTTNATAVNNLDDQIKQTKEALKTHIANFDEKVKAMVTEANDEQTRKLVKQMLENKVEILEKIQTVDEKCLSKNEKEQFRKQISDFGLALERLGNLENNVDRISANVEGIQQNQLRQEQKQVKRAEQAAKERNDMKVKLFTIGEGVKTALDCVNELKKGKQSLLKMRANAIDFNLDPRKSIGSQELQLIEAENKSKALNQTKLLAAREDLVKEGFRKYNEELKKRNEEINDKENKSSLKKLDLPEFSSNLIEKQIQLIQLEKLLEEALRDRLAEDLARKIEGDKNEIQSFIQDMKQANLEQLQKFEDSFNNQIRQLKLDVNEIKGDVGGLKQENVELKIQLSQIQNTMNEFIAATKKQQAAQAQENLELRTMVSTLQSQLTQQHEETRQGLERIQKGGAEATAAMMAKLNNIQKNQTQRLEGAQNQNPLNNHPLPLIDYSNFDPAKLSEIIGKK